MAQTVKASACSAGHPGSIPGSGRFPWRRKRQPTPGLLPGKSHGQRGLVGYSSSGHKESDMTERLHSIIYHNCSFNFHQKCNLNHSGQHQWDNLSHGPSLSHLWSIKGRRGNLPDETCTVPLALPKDNVLSPKNYFLPFANAFLAPPSFL